MSAASVAVIYADRGKSARVFVQFFCFFVMRPIGPCGKVSRILVLRLRRVVASRELPASSGEGQGKKSGGHGFVLKPA
jgi:hypothetical protein